MSEIAFESPPPMNPLPKPMLWRVLVKPYEMEKKTLGGIELPDEYLDKTKYLVMVGKVEDMGTFAFKAKTSSGLDFAEEENSPTIGDWVLYGKYAGQRIRYADGKEYVILNDDEIIAKVDDPAAFVSYA